MPPASSPATIIRPARAADAAALTALGRLTFTDTFGADNTPDDLAAFLNAAYTTDRQEAELADPALTSLVAERDGALVAFALLRTGRPSPFVPDPTAIELQRFYLDRSCQGTGLAQGLMTAVMQEAERRGAATLFLGVWERNTRALRFYAAQGFVDVGSQIFTVGTDPQRDRVLARPVVAADATASSAAPE
jgi:ribosomal protein S18 acetylase RimI-like enzyme